MYIKFKNSIKKKEYNIKVVRDLINKDLTNFNFLSNILFKFLVCMTFYLSDGHFRLLKQCEDVYANCEEYIGSYCYRKIGEELKIIRVLKKFNYFKNMMKKEPCRDYYQLIKNVKRFCIDLIKTIKYLGRPIKLKFIYSMFKNIF